MDIVTKLFLVNWIVIIFVAFIDKKILNDVLENGRFVYILGSWALVSLASIPAYLIYLIVTA